MKNKNSERLSPLGPDWFCRGVFWLCPQWWQIGFCFHGHGRYGCAKVAVALVWQDQLRDVTAANHALQVRALRWTCALAAYFGSKAMANLPQKHTYKNMWNSGMNFEAFGIVESFESKCVSWFIAVFDPSPNLSTSPAPLSIIIARNKQLKGYSYRWAVDKHVLSWSALFSISGVIRIIELLRLLLVASQGSRSARNNQLKRTTFAKVQWPSMAQPEWSNFSDREWSAFRWVLPC